MLIIWGTAIKKPKIGTGTLLCPHCGKETQHTYYRCLKYFAFFFIPMDLREDLGAFAKCSECGQEHQAPIKVLKEFASALGIKSETLIDDDVIEKLEPFKQTIIQYITCKEDINCVAQNIASETQLPFKVALHYCNLVKKQM
jgi:hypothetical protein